MKRLPYLFLIIIAAFIVRLVGIRYGLPFLYHDDEPLLVNYALAYGAGDFNPHVFNFAPFLTYCLFLLYGIFYVIGYVFGHFHSVKDFAYLYINDPTVFYLIGRSALGLLCGTAAVYVIYLAGKKYFNETTGLIASLFLAFNFLHVRDSHYIYFDIPLTLCVLIFFVKAYDLFKPARGIDYAWLGGLLGLSISIKYQGIALLAPFAAIMLYNMFTYRDTALRDKINSVIWCFGAFIAVMFICNPFLFLNLSGFMAKVPRLPYMPVPLLYHIKISLFNGCGAPMIITAMIGMILIFIRRDRAVLIAIYVIFYYFIVTKATQPGERLVLPIVPLLLLCAADIISRTIMRIKNKQLSVFTGCFAVLILLYPSLENIYYSDSLFLKEDTRTQAYHWIKDNIKPGTKIALDATTSGFPKLEKDKEQIKGLEKYFGQMSFGKPANADRTKLQFMLDNPSYPEKTYYLFYMRNLTKRGFLSIYPCINVRYSELENNDVEYVVLSNIMTDARCGDFMSELERRAVPVKTFSPYKEGVSRIRSAELSTVPAAAFAKRELIDRKSYGPYIKIYKILK